MKDKPLKILHLEDNPADVELVTLTLEQEGMAVLVTRVETREEFTASLENCKFDLILADYSLPVFDGLSALKIAREICPDTPFILLSGTLGEELAIDCLKGGATDYVLKQRMSRLVPSVQRALLEAQERIKRRKTEAALRRAEERYRELVEKAGIAILIDDEEGHFIYFNHRFAQLFGYTEKEIRKKNIRNLVHPDDLEMVMDYHQQRFGGKKIPTRYEFRGIRKDGRVIFLEVEADLISEEDLKGTRSYLWDITSRKEAEQELARLALVVEQAGESIVITDLEGNMGYVNPAFEKLTGYNRDEVLGQNFRMLKSGEHEETFYPEFWEQVTAGKTWHGLFCNRKKNGDIIYEDTIVFPVQDSSGQIRNFVAIQRDITEQKKLEEQLYQAQKMEAVGNLAGGVAHDFNNLLTVINGYSELLLSRLHSEDSIRKEITQIKNAGDRAARLTNQLLAFSRRQVVKPEILNLNEIVGEMDKMLRRLIGEDIELVTSTEPGLGNIKMDRGQIEQIIMNLAVNARDAMPEGGKLTIETATFEMDKTYMKEHLAAQEGSYVMLSVSDNGCGMTPEVKSQIFEPFFTTKEKGKGTGLGLSTVYGIVKQNHGFIWVYSEPGMGSTFKIYLPRLEQEAAAYKEIPFHTESLIGSETILLVEDDEDVRQFTRQLLAEQGYSLLEAGNGEQALKTADDHLQDIDALLTDVILPGISGRELVDQLLERRPDLKVIYLSGYTDNAIVHHGVLEPGMTFIQKPFSAKTLLTTLRQKLDEHRAD